MKLRKNKCKIVPGIVACCSFLIAIPCSAAGLSTNEPIDSIRQNVVVSPHQPAISSAYQYTGVESLEVTKVFQKNNTVYLRLAPEGAMDAPEPILLPKNMQDLYLKNKNSLNGWKIHKYIRYVKYPNVQELRFDFYDKQQHYQGTATTMYWLP